MAQMRRTVVPQRRRLSNKRETLVWTLANITRCLSLYPKMTYVGLLLLLCVATCIFSMYFHNVLLDGRFNLYHSLQSIEKIPERILVVYSGPTSLNITGLPPDQAFKQELYIKNFEYFVRHSSGVDCQNHDTILVVTSQVYESYKDEIERYHQTHDCDKHNHFVKLIVRENVCFDMESVRLVLHGHVPSVNISTYDYFVYANCGTTGPAPRSQEESHWTKEFTRRFDDKVRMVGVSHHCYPVKNVSRPHIQSIAYSLDKRGIELIRNSNTVYDCRRGGGDKGSVIERYEVGMSKYLMAQNYSVRSIMRNTTLSNFSGPCTGRDVWMTSRLKEAYGGRLPTFNETIFWKTSRILTPEIAELINFTGPIKFNW